jgi:hypothetical protein
MWLVIAPVLTQATPPAAPIRSQQQDDDDQQHNVGNVDEIWHVEIQWNEEILCHMVFMPPMRSSANYQLLVRAVPLPRAFPAFAAGEMTAQHGEKGVECLRPVAAFFQVHADPLPLFAWEFTSFLPDWHCRSILSFGFTAGQNLGRG